MFVNSQGKSAAAIEQALDGADTELAHRLAHTAKGVAGNIGATGVLGIAGQLEQSIRNAAPLHATRVLLEEFAIAMRVLVENICAALGTREIEPPVRVKPLDRTKVDSVIAKLTGYLNNSDSESGYYFESVRDSLLGEFSGDEIRDLEHSIGDYDFKSASNTLVAHAVGAERMNNAGK
jgi:HPt (histidine-containing phosphotransfer) domain-containing protein